MDKSVSVCFTGHRPQKLPWGNREKDPRCLLLCRDMEKRIIKAIKEGYYHFISGMALGTDMIAAQLVLELKKRYPHITLECALPFSGQANQWDLKDQTRFKDILEKADKVTVVCPFYSRSCFMERNRYMVDHSSLLIAVCNFEESGTLNTIRYAYEQKIPVDVFDLRTHYKKGGILWE